MIPSKTCTKCGKEKSLEGFYAHRSCSDGKMGECKKCWGEYRKKYWAGLSPERRSYINRNKKITCICTLCGKKYHPFLSSKNPKYCSRECYFKVVKTRKCVIEGCNEKHRALGYCNKHFSRYRRHGNPLQIDRRKPQRRKRNVQWDDLQGSYFTPYIKGNGFQDHSTSEIRIWCIMNLYFSEQRRIGGHLTLQEIAEVIGLSRERIRQITERQIERSKFRNRLMKHRDLEKQHDGIPHG